MKRLTRAALLLTAAAALISAGRAAELPFAKERIEWNKPQKPFHVIGNIYYVGIAGVSAFLIITPEGHILTDGGLQESVPHREEYPALGFRLRTRKSF